jgi:serine beta-lactamase-like protein LACTB, mitochondrial
MIAIRSRRCSKWNGLPAAALLAFACLPTVAVPPDAPPAEPPSLLDAEIARARQLMAELSREGVGLSVAVARDRRVIWSEAYGWADRERQRPATPDSLFRLYSISKPMTAAAAARLLESGRIDPDAPVQRWLPDFPEMGAPITPMLLATHRSGIRHYREGEASSRQHCADVASGLPIFAADPLVHPPGGAETYSSWGYVLLSAVVEKVAGVPYPDAMRELVFDPLGLTGFEIDDPERELPRRTGFYSETAPRTFGAEEPVDNTCKWGAGAWLGTAEDVARFGLALVDGALLRPETQQLLLAGRPIFRAQGIGAGGMAIVVADDGEDLAVALLSNATGEALGPALQDAAANLHGIFVGSEGSR